MSALTGQAITVGHGTVTYTPTSGGNVTVHISGVEATFLQGIVVIGPTLIAGSGATSAAGTVTPSGTVALTGSAITSSAGTVIPDLGVEDTYISSAQGSPAAVVSLPLTGSEVTTAQGTVTASAQDQTAALNAVLVEVLVLHGTATPVLSLPLSGNSATFAQENMGAPGYAELTGSSITVEQGFLGREMAITGQEITSAQGSIVGLPGIVALVGQSVTVEQGGMVSTGTNWTDEPDPTTTWTPKASPNSAWTRKGGPSTGWNRK
jgi:hypothetical protein